MRKILTPVLFFACLHLTHAQLDRDEPRTARDQVIADDLIVDGSICVGFDCVNGEQFGFKTLVLKENNVRIKFFDTSNSASFPKNDWCLEANATTNGGTEHFAIVDESGGRTPFKIIAGAPNNSIFVSSGGKVGLGTGVPVVELHIADGDSPTLRLEQNGSSGFTAQTWDVAGNETNFFVRDATNGSKLPFRIRPSAPSNSIFVNTNGDIGLGTASPTAALDIAGSTFFIGSAGGATDARVEIGKGRTANGNAFFDLIGDQTAFPDFGARFIRLSNGNTQLNHRGTGLLIFRAQEAANMTFETNNIERMRITSTGNVDIIGSATVNGGMAVTSDRRLKSNTRSLERGLKEVLLMNPVMYSYTGKANTLTDREYAGIIAQDLQEIAPEFVSNRKYEEMNAEGELIAESNYLQVHDTELKYVLVNAIKEQNQIIEVQKEELADQNERITELEADLMELKNLVQNLQNNIEVTLNGKELGYLGQNTPNPYNGETNITYVIPSTAHKSSINIHSVEGKLIKTIDLNHKGKGQIKVNASNLPGGIYSYQLIVDGKLVETKKMVLQK